MNVPNASMARQVEQAGFDAVYVSGAGVINSTAGMPDIGLLKRDEVVKLAEKFGFQSKAIAMKNTHHAKMTELLIGKNLDWLATAC